MNGDISETHKEKKEVSLDREKKLWKKEEKKKNVT